MRIQKCVSTTRNEPRNSCEKWWVTKHAVLLCLEIFLTHVLCVIDRLLICGGDFIIPSKRISSCQSLVWCPWCWATFLAIICLLFVCLSNLCLCLSVCIFPITTYRLLQTLKVWQLESLTKVTRSWPLLQLVSLILRSPYFILFVFRKSRLSRKSVESEFSNSSAKSWRRTVTTPGLHAEKSWLLQLQDALQILQLPVQYYQKKRTASSCFFAFESGRGSRLRQSLRYSAENKWTCFSKTNRVCGFHKTISKHVLR